MAEKWTTKQIPSLAGKRAIVTGANIGLGFQTARALARAGAQVVLACRSMERGNAAAEKIKAEQPSAQVFVAQLDLSSLASVRRFAASVLTAGEPLDILVNNAGISMPPKKGVTEDGFELQLGTNYLGHFALTGLLLPVLLKADAPRVVSVSSNAHKRGKLYLDDFQQERSYSALMSYSQSKLAMLVFAKELQRRSDAHGGKLVSLAAHPGLSATNITREMNAPVKLLTEVVFAVLGQSDAEGALPQLYAATSAQAEPGGYYGPSGFKEFKGAPAKAKVMPQAMDPESARGLWTASEKATGEVYKWPAAG